MSGRKKAMTQPIVSHTHITLTTPAAHTASLFSLAFTATPYSVIKTASLSTQLTSPLCLRLRVLCVRQNQIFRLLQRKERVLVWLYENTTIRVEGVIIGFDEYMNVVLDEATEVDRKKKTRTELGRILLKGDNISLIQQAAPQTDKAAAAAVGGVR